MSKRIAVNRSTPPVASPAIVPPEPAQMIEVAHVVPQMNAVLSDCIETLALEMRHYRKRARAGALDDAENKNFTRHARTVALMIAAEDQLKQREGLGALTDELLLKLVPAAMKALAEEAGK